MGVSPKHHPKHAAVTKHKAVPKLHGAAKKAAAGKTKIAAAKAKREHAKRALARAVAKLNKMKHKKAKKLKKATKDHFKKKVAHRTSQGAGNKNKFKAFSPKQVANIAPLEESARKARAKAARLAKKAKAAVAKQRKATHKAIKKSAHKATAVKAKAKVATTKAKAKKAMKEAAAATKAATTEKKLSILQLANRFSQANAAAQAAAHTLSREPAVDAASVITGAEESPEALSTEFTEAEQAMANDARTDARVMTVPRTHVMTKKVSSGVDKAARLAVLLESWSKPVTVDDPQFQQYLPAKQASWRNHRLRQ